MRRSARLTLRRRPNRLKALLDGDQAKLYELIWLRTMASQMELAELERTTADITAHVGRSSHRSARDRYRGQIRRLPDTLSGRPGR